MSSNPSSSISLVECDANWVPKDSEANGSNLQLPVDFDISTSKLTLRWRYPAPIPNTLHLGIFGADEEEAQEETVWDIPISSVEGQRKFIVAANKVLIPGKQYVFRFFLPRISESLATRIVRKFKVWSKEDKPGDFMDGASRTLTVTSAKYRMEQEKNRLQAELDAGTSQVNADREKIKQLQQAIDAQLTQNEKLSENIAALQHKIDTSSTAPASSSTCSDEDTGDIDMTSGPPPYASPAPVNERHRTASSVCEASAEPDAKKTKL